MVEAARDNVARIWIAGGKGITLFPWSTADKRRLAGGKVVCGYRPKYKKLQRQKQKQRQKARSSIAPSRTRATHFWQPLAVRQRLLLSALLSLHRSQLFSFEENKQHTSGRPVAVLHQPRSLPCSVSPIGTKMIFTARMPFYATRLLSPPHAPR